MKRFRFVVVLCLVLGGVYASQNIIPLSSPLYDDMEMLYIRTGKSIPSASKPWTENQARLYLQRIDQESLSAVGVSLYGEIEEELDALVRWRLPGGFTMGTWLDGSVEAYAHTNTDYASFRDWTYSFVDRKPLLRLRLAFTMDPFFATYCDLQYGYGLYTSGDTLTKMGSAGYPGIGALVDASSYGNLVLVDGSSTQNLYTSLFSTNLIQHSRDFDFQWPKRANVSFGGSNWNFSLARDRISWGSSHIGNMVLDDHADFHDFARFTAFSPYFSYEATYLFPDWEYQTSSSSYDSSNTTFRVFMLHRLEFRPWDKVMFSVSENVMYKDTSYLPQYLNPSFLYHNLNMRDRFNAIASVEASWVFLPGWNLYGQFTLDQAVAPNENPDSESNAWGASTGVEWIGELGEGMLRTAFEGAFTLPCMYRRDGIDFIYSQRYAGLNDSQGSSWNAQLFDYFGFPYGGDAVVVKWDSSWSVPNKGSAGFAMTLLLHGPVTMYTDVTEGGGYTSYGMMMFKGGYVDASLVCTLNGSWNMPAFRFLQEAKLYGSLSYIQRTHYQGDTGLFSEWSNDLQCTLGMTFSL